MTHLFIVSVGPVQEFIASARRSRDLWFGSWLLSELSKAAAHRIVIEQQNDLNCLIFPKPDTLADLDGTNQAFSVANKIVALITQAPQIIGERVSESLQAQLQAIREDAFARLRGKEFYVEIANAQLEDLVECFWAAVPIDNPQDATAYQVARRQAEALLAARKITRDFNPVRWGSETPKSSLDGLRESVINEAAYPSRNVSAEQRHQIARRLRLDYGVREGERLCGVGLLKRHGNRGGEDRFFSTSHVAALPLLAKLKSEHAQAVENYVNVYRNQCGLTEPEVRQALGNVPYSAYPTFQRYDGHLLFEERLAELIGEEKNREQALQTARIALRSFLDQTFGKGVRPLPYYALLHADGDHMGKAIDAQATAEQHRKLSSSLTAFAKKVPEIVAKHQGSLVYTGGDDVLAFVPLHTVLPCAQRLANEFKAILNEFTTGEHDAQNQPITPTLSAGIAITHHIEPLSDALQLARAAEKTAKQIKGKDALAITLSKRSGVDRTVAGKWNELDKRLETLSLLHMANAVPDGAAYELQELARRLADYPEAMRAEALRLLKRKRAEHGNKAVKDDKTVFDELARLIQHPDLPMAQLADELIIARLFAQAAKQAGIKPEILQDASV